MCVLVSQNDIERERERGREGERREERGKGERESIANNAVELEKYNI